MRSYDFGGRGAETVRLLLQRFASRPKAEKQAYVDAPNEFGNTALHWAALGGHLDTVKLLAEEHGATQAVANDRNYVALDLALFNGHEDVAEYFLAQVKGLESKNGGEGGLEGAVEGIELEGEEVEDGDGKGKGKAKETGSGGDEKAE